MKKRFLAALILTACCVVTVMADEKKPALSAAEIIDKHLEAVGGRQKLSQLKSRIAVGTVKRESDPEARMAIVSEVPNRVSAVFIFTNFDLRFIYDGSNVVIRPPMPRQYVMFYNKYREMAASGLMYNGISLYNLLLQPPAGVKFEAKGTKKVRGNDAYVVEVKRSGTDAMRLYFDAQSFMWVRTDYGKSHFTAPMKQFTNAPVAHGDEELTVDFYIETSEFKDVDGLKLPFKFEQVVTAPILGQAKSGTIVGRISEYRHNEPIDPKMFQ